MKVNGYCPQMWRAHQNQIFDRTTQSRRRGEWKGAPVPTWINHVAKKYTFVYLNVLSMWGAHATIKLDP